MILFYINIKEYKFLCENGIFLSDLKERVECYIIHVYFYDFFYNSTVRSINGQNPFSY